MVVWRRMLEIISRLLYQANGDSFPETECFDQQIISFMQKNEIPGVATAVLLNGKIVYAQGYGDHDVPDEGRTNDTEPRRKVMPYTPFRLGGVSMPVTSLAVLRLVQQGKLSLSDRVFGPDAILQFMSENPRDCCPIADRRIEAITIRDLLSHTAGWSDRIQMDSLLYSTTSSAWVTGPGENCEDLVYFMLGQPLQYEPGTTFSYSNFGYCILERVLVNMTGTDDLEQAVRDLLLDPAEISQLEMYIGSTHLVDIPEYESEYDFPGCISDCFESLEAATAGLHDPADPYSGLVLETLGGRWVSSAPQVSM